MSSKSTVPPRNLEFPDFTPSSDPKFTWGDVAPVEFNQRLDAAYLEVVHWRQNLFKVPQGHAGKAFVLEMARLFNAFATGSALESIALKAASILPPLLLQKPSRSSKMKDHIKCLERRLKTWRAGDLMDLITEGRTIQHRLPKISRRSEIESQLASSFAKLMFQGKVKQALDLLSKKVRGRLLHLDDSVQLPASEEKSVRQILKEKHPVGQDVHPEATEDQSPSSIHPVLFESLDGPVIRSAAMRTRGAAGPSGLDAQNWRRLCTSFKSASIDLCNSLAATARRLCTTLVDPKSISALLSCRLLALDKNPGVRPIGVGETPRRIIAKAILSIVKEDIQEAAGTQQLCAGQIAGAEAAAHAVRESFECPETEAILLVDATNAFNCLNRKTALHNILRTCPSIATIALNCYRQPTNLFVDGDVILSDEGVTQGDPLAMPIYAVATVPLIRKLEIDNDARQMWYADDACATGTLENLRTWWDKIMSEGPAFGYYPKASKSWLVTKSEFASRASTLFSTTKINISCEGRPYLGAPIGTRQFVENFVNNKVSEWSDDVSTLADIAKSQPHAAYAAITHGLSSKWSYLSRVTKDIGSLLEPLEITIRTKLIPNLTNQPAPSDLLRNLLALPARLGGIALTNPSVRANDEFQASLLVTRPLKTAITNQATAYTYDIMSEQMNAKASIRASRTQSLKAAADQVKSGLPPVTKRAMDLAMEHGSSSWLTSLPIEEFGFSLHKGAFFDALALRYGWLPARLPSHCTCGNTFTVEHSLSCPRGGFPIIRHNEIRDLTANLLSEVCHDVRIEPDLQPLTGETLAASSAITDDGARLEIAANGVWGGRFERTFMDVRVFNPLAPSNSQSTLAACYRKHERAKKRSYEQRVRDTEHATFTPLVLSATGGMGREAATFYRRLASLLAVKWDQPYSSTMSWLRCRITFSLLRSAIQCLRGARSRVGHPVTSFPAVDVIISESRLGTQL